LEENTSWNHRLETEVKQQIRNQCSPRHVPDIVYKVKDIPQTINSKKLEVPIKKF